MDEPTGHTIDGTPWEEARPPHLPDPVVRASRGIAIGAWVFIALAIALTLWYLRDPGAYFPQNLVDLVVGTAQPVATCLLGAALFLRHPRAWQTDPRIVFGISLLVAAVLLQIASSQFSDVLMTIAPSDDGTNPFFAGGQVSVALMTRTIEVFGLLYLARGLVDARELEDDDGARRRGILTTAIAAIAVAVTVGLVYFPWSRGELDLSAGWAVAYYVGLVLIGNGTIVSTAYLTATASTGWASGEQPHAGWRDAALGLWLVFLAGLVLSATYLVGYLVRVGASDTETLFGVLRIAAIAAAAGYLLVLAGFARGLPGVDEVARDEDGSDVDAGSVEDDAATVREGAGALADAPASAGATDAPPSQVDPAIES